jgi:hypothetical protein
MDVTHNQLKKNGKKGFRFIRYPRSRAWLAVALLVLFLPAACSVSHRTYRKSSDPSALSSAATKDADVEKISVLQDDLADLNRQANMPEARQVAETAITYAGELAAEYQLVRPAVFHNILVRVGLKDRGLCYHWTEDMMKRLQSLELETYQLHWGVAYRGSELREHNSVVITARGQSFENGIVLDPWRHSGDLFWVPVKTDTYPWEELPPDKW